MNGPHAKARRHGGGYVGEYRPTWSTEMRPVTDPSGKPYLFRDQWQAEAMAWRECRRVEEDTFKALREDDCQVQPMPKFYEPRSQAGKKAFAARRLEQALKEIAGT